MVVLLLPLDYFILDELLNVPFGTVYYFTFFYFVGAVLFIQFYLNSSLKKRPQQFIWSFMGALGLKMFLSLLILLIVIYAGIADPKTYGINYISLYMIFSVFSVIQILKAQRASIPKQED
ncbi:MAG: hypothetical protein RIE58_06450 [Vicingaceae bacterium]